MESITFKNRIEAGRNLAVLLDNFKNDINVIIYGLPRGGMEVAKQVSTSLHAPLEPLIVKKVGHPHDPEFAIGAVSEDSIITDDLTVEEIDSNWLDQQAGRLQQEIKKRKALYLGDREPRSPAGKVAIIVDDGVATGLTLKAAINYLRKRKAGKIIVAIPVISADVAKKIEKKVDSLLALNIADNFFGSVGSYYDEFEQVSDQEVVDLMKDPIIFNMPVYDYLADHLFNLPDISQGRYQCDRFEDDEIQVKILRDVTGDRCIVLSTLVPPDHNMIETLLLVDTLKKEGAKDVTLIVPFLSYMRQDRDESGRSLAASWIAKLIQSSGVDNLVTIDIHSQFALNFFKIPIVSLSPFGIFIPELEEKVVKNSTLIAPDESAIHRCELIKRELRLDLPISYFEKEHHRDEVSPHLVGEVSPDVIIVDDILDTGTTLISACRALKDHGVQNIIIIVTHGLFTNPLWEDLWELNVSDIFTTDTVPISRSIKAKGVTVLSVVPILKSYIENNF